MVLSRELVKNLEEPIQYKGKSVFWQNFESLPLSAQRVGSSGFARVLSVCDIWYLPIARRKDIMSCMIDVINLERYLLIARRNDIISSMIDVIHLETQVLTNCTEKRHHLLYD